MSHLSPGTLSLTEIWVLLKKSAAQSSKTCQLVEATGLTKNLRVIRWPGMNTNVYNSLKGLHFWHHTLQKHCLNALWTAAEPQEQNQHCSLKPFSILCRTNCELFNICISKTFKNTMNNSIFLSSDLMKWCWGLDSMFISELKLEQQLVMLQHKEWELF